MDNVTVAVGRDDCIAKLTSLLQNILSNCATDGIVTLGISGGSMPSMLCDALPKLSNFDLKRFKFLFCDERLVPYTDPESTFGAYKSLLREKLSSIHESQFVVLDDPNLTAEQCARQYESQLRDLSGCSGNEWPNFDALLLGLGPDGHTCSLFPGHSLLLEDKRWVAAITDSPKPPPQRITLTLPLLNHAKNVIFIATGANKAEVLKSILCDKDCDLPASRVRPKDGKLYWILDTDAARMLNIP